MALADRVADRAAELVRADPVTLEEFGYMLEGANNSSRIPSGGSTSKTRAGVPMGVSAALSIPAWYSGVYYLSTSVAYLPWGNYRRQPGTSRERRAEPQWMARPDVEMPWPALVEFWLMSLLHRGNAYAFKVRNTAMQVVGLRAVHPDRVRVGQASDGTKVFQIDGRQDIGFTTREILHIPGLSYDGVLGIDPIRQHAEALATVSAAEQFAGRSFGNGTHLQAYISVPQQLTPEQADELKAQWRRFHQGVQNANDFGVLGNDAEYKTISLDPEQTQLLQTRKFGTTQIAQLLRIPPHKLYDLERATFSNIEHQAIESVTDSVKPWVERIETWVNFDPDLHATNTYIEADLDGLLRGDIKTRFDAYATAIEWGAMEPAEWRSRESWDELDGTHYTLRPMNYEQIGPDAAAVDGDESPRAIAETIQKIYLGVPDVLTAEEARDIVNRLGAGLSGQAPTPEVQAP